MYKAITVQVKPDSDLFEWCDRNALCDNNLNNAALFRERQLMFASKKNIHELTDICTFLLRDWLRSREYL